MPFDFDQIIDRRHSNSVKWNAYPEEVLPLWVADMDFVSPAPIVTALRAAVDHGVFGYPLVDAALRETVVARMKKLYNWEIAPESLVATSGLVSGFYAAAGTLCRPGDGYLIQPPVYMPFNGIQKNLGAIRQEAELVKISENGRVRYEIDWERFEKAFHAEGSQTRMFLLCNPHNPTGQIYTTAELNRMAETCLKNGTVIVSDEIHSELLLDGTPHTPVAALAPEIADRSITLIAPSKTFNVAGFFCGFAIIPNAELRQRFQEQAEKMTMHVSSLALIAAQAAFSGECDDWLAELRLYLRANRDFLLDFVAREIPEVGITKPSATYLAWLDCSALVANGKISGAPGKFFLDKAKVALNDGEAFGTGGKNFVRLNFGCPRSLLVEALERMQAALQA